MSAVVCFVLVSMAGYLFAYLPAVRQRDEYKREYDAQVAADVAARKAAAALLAEETNLPVAHGVLIVATNPPGAKVIIGDFGKTTPAKFTDIVPGTSSIVIRADGYEDYKQDVTVEADKPLDLGTIQLVPKAGDLSLTSPESDVSYSITGPANYSHDGKLPDKVEKLPIGNYQLTVWQDDWKLPPIAVVITDQNTVQKDIKFPYASLNITTSPPGATVRQGHTVLGKTPLALAHLRPNDLSVSIDLPPYTLQRMTIHLPDFGNIDQSVTLHQDKDFVAASGMPMVWIPDSDYWVGKYLVRQSDFQTVTGTNPSTFRRPNRPVETVSWEEAMAFCDKLNQYERKAGKLPAGYHYTLPTESQWETFSADADIDQAAMSRASTLPSTMDVGASEPNKYGLYDTLGNVWEWCLDVYDDKGNHTLRGGSWLSSPEDFPGADKREGGGPKYADRFTGFRVVLVPN
jgi:hypothetical protein